MPAFETFLRIEVELWIIESLLLTKLLNLLLLLGSDHLDLVATVHTTRNLTSSPTNNERTNVLMTTCPQILDMVS